MKLLLNRILILFALPISLFILAQTGFAESPAKRGKLVFFTPPPIEGLTAEEVMEEAAALEAKKDYSEAIQMLKAYLKKNPEDKFAPEMSFRIAKIYIKKDKYSKAYDILETIFDKYSNISNPDRILERFFFIANSLYEGKKRKVLGIPLARQYSKAITIYERIISHAPFGQYADDSQFQIGKSYILLDEREEAISAFQILMKDYPESQHVEEALFLIALNHDKISKKSDYDQTHTEKAIEVYRKFLKSYPESTYYEKATERLNALLTRKGKEIFAIAKFYFDRKKYKAAKIYFDTLIEEYSMTKWADKSTKYLSQIELAEDKNEKNPS